MRTAVGAESDLDLAQKIGSKSTGLVSNWRVSGKVPDRAIAKVSEISGWSVQRIKTGETRINENSSQYSRDSIWEGRFSQIEDPLARGNGPQRDTAKGPKETELDRDLLIEAAATIRAAEEQLGVRVRADKLGELILMLYDEYASGAEVKPAKVLQLVRLAA